jgi:hypothetical protein
MEEKTKASKGASVTKTGTVASQPAALKTKATWEQPPARGAATPELCQDNSPASILPKTAASALKGKKTADKQVIGEQIGRQLRSVYNDVLAEPVPDRFLDLLRTLEKDHK